MLNNQLYKKPKFDTKLLVLVIPFAIFAILALVFIFTTASISNKGIDNATELSGSVATVNNNDGRFDLTLKNDPNVYYISKSFYAEHKDELNAIRVGDSVTISVVIEKNLSPILEIKANGASLDTSASIIEGWEENKQFGTIMSIITSAIAICILPFLVRHILCKKRRSKK